MASRKLLPKTVCVVGLGSAGLPLAEAFAEHPIRNLVLNLLVNNRK